MRDRTAGLSTAAQHAREFLGGLDERPVAARVDAAIVRDALGGPLPEHGEAPDVVIDALVAGAEPGLVATAGPRHFGFVIGGALPAALSADWLVSAWDQNAAFHSLSPAAAAVEEITAAWALDLFGLPETASVGFVTGGQGANTTCLAAARHSVLAKAGWNVEDDGLIGAPPVHILCGEQAHATIDTALRQLGLGAKTPIRIEADDQGRMRADALRDALSHATGPTIVCAQAGNVATGAFDAFEPIADACTAHGAWLHVDGAFGLWAAAAPALRHLTNGVERADSWAVDAHKWLNVPYDGAMAIVADSDAHVAAMGLAGPYLVADPGQRDGTNYVPESSRRARVVPIYAALRSLGRTGRGRADRTQLRSGQTNGRATGCDSRRADRQRRGTQSGAGATAGWRRRQQGSGGRRPARRDLLARRYHLERRVCASGFHLELGDDRRRCGPVSRSDSTCRGESLTGWSRIALGCMSCR